MPKSLQRRWKMADKLVYQKIKKELGGRIRGMVSGGGTLNKEIARFFWAIDIPVLEGYGLTETAPVITTNPMVRAKIGTVGKVLPNLDVKIAEDGEILVRGPSVMKGYYNDDEATNQAFTGDWFKTGDIGVFDEDGYLRIIDRKKRILVLSTGKNVSPQPIENAICESPYIEYALLVGDGKKYVIVLIKPDFEQLVLWAKRKNIEHVNDRLLVKNENIQRLILSEVKEKVREFATFEQPKRIIIVDDEWTVESGEITPKLSVRYKIVEKRYQTLIEKVYESESETKKEVIVVSA